MLIVFYNSVVKFVKNVKFEYKKKVVFIKMVFNGNTVVEKVFYGHE